VTRWTSDRPRAASRAAAPQRGSQLRTWVVLLLLGAVAGVLVGLLTRQIPVDEPAPVAALPDLPAAVREAHPSGPVEVVVRTDVPGGELVVDGELRGVATSGRWVIPLGAGLHKLEARALGAVVTTQVVNVVEGEPLTVFLSMPAGEAPDKDGAQMAAPTRASGGDAKRNADGKRNAKKRPPAPSPAP
jgi:hypothetical protein